MKKEQFDKAIDFIKSNGESHKSKEGKTVHHYSYNFFKDSYSFEMETITALEGEILPTGNACFEFFNLKYFVNLSYCEGDVYAVFFETEKELKEAIRSTMKYYEENEEYQYDITADDYFKRLKFPSVEELTEQAGRDGCNKKEAKEIISGVYDSLKRVYPGKSKRELILIAYTIG